MKKRPAFFEHVRGFISEHKQDGWVLFGLVLATVLISAPVYYRQVRVMANDYNMHIGFTRSLLDGRFQDVPLAVYSHPLYQLVLYCLRYLTFQKIGLFALAALVQVVTQAATVLVVYFWLERPLKPRLNWLRAALALSLALVAPVMAFVFWDKLYYLGYIGLEIFHNPTTSLLRPIAVASFICAVRIFTAKRSSWKLILLAAGLMILAALIKPNYAICVLPALAVMAALYLILRKPLDWRMLWLGFFVPGVVVLAAQWLVTYLLGGKGGDHIVVDFLAVMNLYSDYLLPKLLLSLLFPLTALALNFRKMIREDDLLLAWIGLLIGLVQMYALAETGDRFTDGNFLWGAQIMLFLVFICSVRFLWREIVRNGFSWNWRKVVPYAAYALHLIAGAAYCLHAFLVTNKSPF